MSGCDDSVQIREAEAAHQILGRFRNFFVELDGCEFIRKGGTFSQEFIHLVVIKGRFPLVCVLQEIGESHLVILILLGVRRGYKARKARIQFLGIVYFGNQYPNAVVGERYGLHAQRHIIDFKAQFRGCLLHHLPKKASCFFAAICEFIELDVALNQIKTGQRAADLILADAL